ncbi:hypothetical protein KI387_021421 [Taxus chinensis]|uniref:Lon N-terminal domain-containing protein n=1 Tax=Taxus chinensis TaxID=29808 RepID=A0AA38GDR1_TAXCH|nr:hypothetical protein KI387_021421 [Taxus chinensis]
MLKAISYSYPQSLVQRLSFRVSKSCPLSITQGRAGKVPLLRFWTSLREQNKNVINPAYRWRCFCSESESGGSSEGGSSGESGGSGKADVAAAVEEAPVKSPSSAIVSTNPRPEDYLKVIALPLPHRPLFPGFYMPIYVKDPKLLAALVENRKRSVPYAGAFLVKDEPETGSRFVSGSETEKNIYELKGEALYKRLHEVGTLAQITSIQGDQVVLIGHRRLRITEMVSEDPLTVKVDHLKEKPYDNEDDVIKATAFEVITTLRDVLKTSSLWRDHVQTYTQHVGDFTFPRLADFGAAISGANKLQCQAVLEELDVYKRLKLSLEISEERDGDQQDTGPLLGKWPYGMKGPLPGKWAYGNYGALLGKWPYDSSKRALLDKWPPDSQVAFPGLLEVKRNAVCGWSTLTARERKDIPK